MIERQWLCTKYQRRGVKTIKHLTTLDDFYVDFTPPRQNLIDQDETLAKTRIIPCFSRIFAGFRMPKYA